MQKLYLECNFDQQAVKKVKRLYNLSTQKLYVANFYNKRDINYSL